MPLCSVYSSAATSDDSLKVFDFAKAASSQWVRLWSKLREKERERMIYLKAELLFIDANEQQLGHSFLVVSLFIITAFAYHRYLVFAPTKTTTTMMMMMVILPPCLSVCLFLLFSSIASTL